MALKTIETQERELLTANELSQRLKLSNQCIYRLTAKGIIPAVRIGSRTLRYDPQQVQGILKPTNGGAE